MTKRLSQTSLLDSWQRKVSGVEPEASPGDEVSSIIMRSNECADSF